MANIEQQLAQQDLATGIKLAGMGAESSAATGYAAGAGAARALGGLFGMEDPRIVEQRALTKAIEEMEAAGGFRDPNNLFKMGEFLIKQGDFERGSKLIELGNQLVGYEGRTAKGGKVTPPKAPTDVMRNAAFRKIAKHPEYGQVIGGMSSTDKEALADKLASMSSQLQDDAAAAGISLDFDTALEQGMEKLYTEGYIAEEEGLINNWAFNTKPKGAPSGTVPKESMGKLKGNEQMMHHPQTGKYYAVDKETGSIREL